MDAADIAMDLRIWIVAALALAFILDPLDVPVASITVVALMILTIFSVDGITFSREDTKRNLRGAFIALLMCFVLNTGITLLCGLYFLGDGTGLWYGWAMIAAMPCAVSTLSVPLIMKEDLSTSLAIVTVSYVSALVITPVLSILLIGDAVDPIEILKYIVAFIIIPVLVSFPLKRLHLTRRMKVPVVNMTLFIIILLSINTNKGFITDSTETVLIILGIAVVRLIALYFTSDWIIRKMGLDNGTRYTYLVASLWKNTGLAVSMCIAILTNTPEAAIPGIICLLVEDIWFSFAINSRKADRMAAMEKT